MAQETLEEAAESGITEEALKFAKKISYPYEEWGQAHLVEDGVLTGIAWQAERMYTKEDMKNAFDSAREFNSLDGIVDVHIVLPMGGDMSDLQPLHFTFEEWFEQFKKKA